MQFIKQSKQNKPSRKLNKETTTDSQDNHSHQTKSRAKVVKKSKFHIFRTIFILLFSIGILSVFFALGMIKGILESTPIVQLSVFSEVSEATRIYDSQGNETDILIKEGSNRLIATSSEIPDHLKNAFVAIEDEDFWEHRGIDINSIVRAIYGVLSSDNSLGGGSTITQQLVKNAVFNVGLNEKGYEKYIRKLQEMYIALLYEVHGSKALAELNNESTDDQTKTQSSYAIKNEILTNYLNIINLGSNTLGVKVAAKRYFNKDLSKISISEAAVLASITKNPTRYNPITHPEENAKRRKRVLEKMLENKFITNEEYIEAVNDDVYNRIKYNDVTTISNVNKVYSYFTDALVKEVEKDLNKLLLDTGKYNDELKRKSEVNRLLYSGGLKIYTTQDPTIQAVVDKQVNNESNYKVKKYSIDYRLSILHKNDKQTHYSQIDIEKYEKNELKNGKYTGLFASKEEANKYIEKFKSHIMKDTDEIAGETLNYILEPQVSFVIMDQHNGNVLALNGGRGEKVLSRTLNRATDTKRQPGSTFKVLTSFAPALEKSAQTLASTFYDSEYFYKEKQFKNWYANGYLGYQNIRAGIIYSLNIIAVRCLMEAVTPQVGVNFAKSLGITSLSDEDLNPASALGGVTYGVSNIELTNAFASIANSGKFNKYKLYTKILNNDGTVLIDNTSTSPKQVMSAGNAYLLTDAMRESMIGNKCYSGSVSVTSTSTRAHFSKMSLAGKSGTTTNNNDIWFVGYSPYYTAGVWAGCDENQTLQDSKNKINNGGTSFHKDIWRKIMEELHKNKNDIGFEKPNNIVSRVVCRKSGLLATDGCKADLRGSCAYTEFFVDGTQPKKKCSFHNANGTVNIPNKYQGLLTDDTLFQDINKLVVPNLP